MDTTNDHNIGVIEQFLSGILSPEEIVHFNERLKTDNEFGQMYRFRIKMTELWNDADEYQHIKDKVKNVIGREKKSKKRFLKPLLTAASIVLIISIYFVINRNFSSDERYVSEINIPEKKATINIYQPETQLRLIEPINEDIYRLNDTITLKWTAGIRDSSNLIVLNQDSIVIDKMISIYDGSFEILPATLPCDNYIWVVKKVEGKGFFTIR
jgi:hypothetical protein